MSNICSAELCDLPAFGRKAYCRLHWVRYRKHGDPDVCLRDRRPASERWKDRYEVDPETGCWNWTGTISRGYGYIRDGAKRSILAHRFVWAQLGGVLIDGLELDHLCRNTRCVNPKHLEQVTGVVNKKRTAGFRLWDTCGRGHDWTPENTVIRPDGRRQCRECLRSSVRQASRRYREHLPAIADWQCTSCRQPKESASYKMCQECRDYRRETTRRNRAKAKGDTA